jgi:hypothetical protein
MIALGGQSGSGVFNRRGELEGVMIWGSQSSFNNQRDCLEVGQDPYYHGSKASSSFRSVTDFRESLRSAIEDSYSRVERLRVRENRLGGRQ